jgi:hypothetical protein
VRRAVAATALAAALAPAAAVADTQQVLLPGPTPFPTASPPLVTVAPPVGATLTFRIHARSDQRVTAGVDRAGRVVAVRALQNLHLTGTGDYLIVVPAPVLDVRPGPGTQSQPGQRRGQILWAGFSSKRRLLSADATLRPGPARRYLPLRLQVQHQGGRYTLTLTNATGTEEVAFQGAGFARELAGLLDRTRRESLARTRLTPVYATIDGLVSQRSQKPFVSAPLLVSGALRFSGQPSAASGGVLDGRTVRFSFVLGDEQPLSRRIVVTGGGEPRMHVEVRPTAVVRGLRPPGGGSHWSASLPASDLLRRLIDTRMELVRSSQYQTYLGNPDALGRNSTVYVYETAGTPKAAVAPARPSSSGGTSALVIVLAVAGALVAAGAATVAWAHS